MSSYIYNSLSYLANLAYGAVYGSGPAVSSAASQNPLEERVDSAARRAASLRDDDELMCAIQEALDASPVRPGQIADLTEEEQLQIACAISLDSSPAAPILPKAEPTEEEQFALAVQASLAAPSTTKRKYALSLDDQEEADTKIAIKASHSKSPPPYLPQVGQKIPLTARIASLEANSPNAEQLEQLAPVYKFFQPIRGDDNCFYTSFALDMFLGFRSLTMAQKTGLIRQFERCRAPQAARDTVVAALRTLLSGTPIRAEDALMLRCVECLRAIGVQYVRENREVLEPFLVEPMTYERLIADLGKMGAQAEEPMIIALVNALDHPVRVVRVTPKLNHIRGVAGSFNYNTPDRSIPREVEPDRVILFTDGHYQLLSKT